MKKALIIVLAVLFGLMLSSQALAATLQKNIVPADAAWVIHLNLEQVLSSRLFEQIRQNEKWDRMLAERTRFTKKFRVDPLKDIRGITVYGMGHDEKQAVACITGAFDKTHLLGLLEFDDRHQEIPYGNAIIHNWDRHEYAAFVGENMLILGKSEDILKAALDVISGAKPDITGSEAGASLNQVPGDSLFTGFAHNISALITGQGAPAVFRKAETALLHVREQGSDMILQAEMGVGSPQDADNIEQILKGLLAMVDMYREEIPAGIHVPEDVQISKTGTSVRVQIAYPSMELMQFLT
jgi:hypothetical protein